MNEKRSGIKDENSDSERVGEEKASSAQKRKRKEKKKRVGRGRRPREEVERVDADGNPMPRTLRYPKRQCALLLGFCGSGYNGMQMYDIPFWYFCSDLRFPKPSASSVSQTSRQSRVNCSTLW